MQRRGILSSQLSQRKFTSWQSVCFGGRCPFYICVCLIWNTRLFTFDRRVTLVHQELLSFKMTNLFSAFRVWAIRRAAGCNRNDDDDDDGRRAARVRCLTVKRKRQPYTLHIHEATNVTYTTSMRPCTTIISLSLFSCMCASQPASAHRNYAVVSARSYARSLLY